MENVLALTPTQQFFILAIHAWMFIIFPLLVIRKLNRITNLLETQAYEEDSEDDTFDSGE